MKLWTLWLPQVAPETYLVPELLQIESIRYAAIEFCEKSLAWQAQLLPYPLPTIVQGADPSIPFGTETGTAAWKILHANLQGSAYPTVTPRTPEWCDENYPGWLDGGQLGKPSNVCQISPDSFVPVPAATGGPWTMIMRVALKPTRDSAQGPDFLFNDYLDAVALGAKARMFMMRDKPWTDDRRASGDYAMFLDKCLDAKVRAAKGFGRGRIRVKGNFL